MVKAQYCKSLYICEIRNIIVSTVTRLWPGLSGIRMLAGIRGFTVVQISGMTMGHTQTSMLGGSFAEESWWGMRMTTRPTKNGESSISAPSAWSSWCAKDKTYYLNLYEHGGGDSFDLPRSAVTHLTMSRGLPTWHCKFLLVWAFRLTHTEGNFQAIHPRFVFKII